LCAFSEQAFAEIEKEREKSMGKLEGKIALVTGGGSGIGRASTLAMAAEGASVAVTDIDQSAGEETCALVKAKGGVARFYKHDVTKEDDWHAVIAGIKKDFGKLHIVLNNAGICITASLADMTLASFQRQNAINVDGVFLGCKLTIPLLTEAGGGAIVNVSSAAGLIGGPGSVGYCASKGAVRLMTKAVAIECTTLNNNIRVNSIHPGPIETPLWLKTANDGNMPEGVKPGSNTDVMEGTRGAMGKVVPMGRAGYVEEIAAGILFLVSQESSYMTGAELVLDGGITAR